MLLTLTQTSNKPLFKSNQIIIIFLVFIGLITIMLFAKKIYLKVYRQKKYYIFPKLTIKGITSIAMTISLSTSIILLLTIITSGALGVIFKAYPGWRVVIEGILIQLGGLLFGPIIGLFIGGVTDLLTISLTAGMFHYGYFFVSIAYGFFSGVVRSVMNSTNNNMFKSNIYLSFLTLIVGAMNFIFILIQDYQEFVISILSFDIKINKELLGIFSLSSVIFLIGLMWAFFFFFNTERMIFSIKKIKYEILINNKNNHYLKKIMLSNNKNKYAYKHLIWYTKKMTKIKHLRDTLMEKQKKNFQIYSKRNWFDYLCPAIYAIAIANMIGNNIMLPFFDIEFSSFGYDYWLALRNIMFIFLVVTNLIVIYPTFKITSSIIKYDYRIDKIENLNLQNH